MADDEAGDEDVCARAEQGEITSVAATAYADNGNEGQIRGQLTLADSLGFALMGGIGGATVAVSDRTDWPLSHALGTNFLIAAILAALGIVASRGVAQRT